MRIAIIDCGTNTFHLLIADVLSKTEFSVLLRENIPVKLGEAGITKKFISEIPFQRGMNTLKNFNEIIHKNKVEKVFAYATAAIRNAVNGNVFIKKAKDETGLDIRLIDGQKEAELIYYGVKQAVHLEDENVLIMDIGGGSVEFIIANNKEIKWKHSFELGAALLLEKFAPSNPITQKEINKIRDYLNKELELLFTEVRNQAVELKNLIGSSGSFETFAEIIKYEFHSWEQLNNSTSYKFNLEEYYVIHNRILKSTTEERNAMKGLATMRVDMIVIASLLITFVLEKTGIKKMTLSSYALKEGILYDVLNNQII